MKLPWQKRIDGLEAEIVELKKQLTQALAEVKALREQPVDPEKTVEAIRKHMARRSMPAYLRNVEQMARALSPDELKRRTIKMNAGEL